MDATSTISIAALRRRRLQGAVIALMVGLACFGATLALDVLVGSTAPFDHAFAVANGAHLVITFEPARADAAAVAGTATATGVVDSAGPWPVGDIAIQEQSQPAKAGPFAGHTPVRIVSASGRDRADSSVDRMTLTAGRWWQGPDEIVLSTWLADELGVRVGDELVVQAGQGTAAEVAAPPLPGASPGPDAAGPPTTNLRVVGIGGSVSTHGPGDRVDAWLDPVTLTSIAGAGNLSAQMLYRVANPEAPAGLAAAAAAIEAALPAHAVESTTTWLATKAGVDDTASLMVPILLAFSTFALLAAAFAVVNIVSGIVIGGRRQIGLLKSVGFTPRQVTFALVGQIAIPAAIGAALGTVAGSVASQPVLAQAALAYGVPALLTLPPVVLLGVPLGALVVVVVAAAGPAWRAGRWTAIEAMGRGSTPSESAFSRQVRQAAAALPFSESIRLGAGRSASRPLRAGMTLGAIAVGVAALTFTFGLEGSLRQVAVGMFRNQAAPVRVELRGKPGTQSVPAPGQPNTARPTPAAMSPQQVEAVIAAQPGVVRWVAIGQSPVTVPGLTQPVPFVAYRGDSTLLGYVLTAGRWFSGPGEVVAPDNFLAASGLQIGDHVTVTAGSTPIDLTIVGSIFDNAREARDNLVLRGDWSTMAAAVPGLSPSSWEVATSSIIEPADWAHELRQATSGAADAEVAESVDSSTGFLLFESVVAMLGLLLIAVSLGGVFNTMLLDGRERARETAILKALGMTPRQVSAMVVASIVPLGLLAGLIGVPVGLALQRAVLSDMARTALASTVPESMLNTLAAPVLIGMVVGGIGLAVLGAWLPARRAARAAIAPVLQSE